MNLLTKSNYYQIVRLLHVWSTCKVNHSPVHFMLILPLSIFRCISMLYTKTIINAGRILRLSFVKCRVDRLYLCLNLYYNSDIFEIAIISTAIFYLGYMQIVALHSMYRHILTIKKEFRTFSSSDRLRAKFVFYFILFNIYPSQNIYAAY